MFPQIPSPSLPKCSLAGAVSAALLIAAGSVCAATTITSSTLPGSWRGVGGEYNVEGDVTQTYPTNFGLLTTNSQSQTFSIGSSFTLHETVTAARSHNYIFQVAPVPTASEDVILTFKGGTLNLIVDESSDHQIHFYNSALQFCQGATGYLNNEVTNISITTGAAADGLTDMTKQSNNVIAFLVTDSNQARTSTATVNSALNIKVDGSAGTYGHKELIWVAGSTLTINGDLTGTVIGSGEGDLRGIRVTEGHDSSGGVYHKGYLILNGTNSVDITSKVDESYSTDYAMRGLMAENADVTGGGSLAITLTDENGYMPTVQGVYIGSDIFKTLVSLDSLKVSAASGDYSENVKGIYINAVNNAQNVASMTIGSDLGVTVSTSGTDETASAVYLDGANASLTVGGTAELTANRTARSGAGSIYGLYVAQGGSAAFNGGLTDTVTMSDSDGGTAAGIYADASTVTVSSGSTAIDVSDSGSSSTVIGIAAEDSSEVSITGTSASVSATGGASATALSASDSTVALTADAVTVTAETADGTLGTAVEAADGSSVYVNSDPSGSSAGGTLAMTGNISVDSSSTALLNFDGSSSSLTGAAVLSSSTADTTVSTSSSGVLNLSFTDGASWNVTGGSTLSTLNAESASIYLGTTSSDWTNTDHETKSFTPVSVIADTLTGDGSSFYLRAAIEENYADTLTFGTATGAYTLYVKSSGLETATVESMDQYLVHIDSGDATFTLGNSAGVVDAGVYIYELAERTTDEGAVEWYLKRIDSTDTDSSDDSDDGSGDDVHSGNNDPSLPPLSPEAETVLILQGGASQTLYYLANLSDLRKRLGDVREQGRAAGVWTSFAASQNNLSAYRTATLKSRLYRANFGADAKVGENWLLGGYMSFATGDQKADNSWGKTTGDSEAQSLSLYATRIWPTGAYVDTVFSVDNYRQTMRTSMLDGTPVKGDFTTLGYGVSVEAGHRLELSEKSALFIEPQLQLAYYRIGSENYTLSSGMTVRQGGVESLTGRAGVVLGTKLLDANAFMGDLYVKAGVLHEFMGSQHIILNGTEDFRIDDLGTRWYYGFGGERYITRAGHASMKIYGQVERVEGNRYTGEYEARLGLKITW